MNSITFYNYIKQFVIIFFRFYTKLFTTIKSPLKFLKFNLGHSFLLFLSSQLEHRINQKSWNNLWISNQNQPMVTRRKLPKINSCNNVHKNCCRSRITKLKIQKSATKIFLNPRHIYIHIYSQ